MTIKSLEYFLVVVKHLNISRAAKELYISQPALSKQIRLLEEELQVILFERVNKSLTLTSVGEVLVKEANDLYQKHAQLIEKVRSAASTTSDVLHIHHMSGSLNSNLPEWIQHFKQNNPNISLQLERSSSSQIFSDLLNNKIQVGILLSATSTCPLPLQNYIIHETPLYLAVPVHHPLAQRLSVSFQDITNETLLLIESQNAPFQHSLLPFFLYMKRYQRNNKIHYLQDMETVVAMTRAGSGISFIARDYCVDIHSLHLIPIKDAVPIRLCMTWNPNFSNKNTEYFIQFIKSCFDTH